MAKLVTTLIEFDRIDISPDATVSLGQMIDANLRRSSGQQIKSITVELEPEEYERAIVLAEVAHRERTK